MNLILFDDPAIRIDLLPFTYIRPTAKIRVGILTIDEKWERWLKLKPSFKTEEYLQQKFPLISTDENLFINGAVCPDEKLVASILALQPGQHLVKNTILLAARNPVDEMNNDNTFEYQEAVTIIDKTWKIFSENAKQIKIDFVLITAGRKSADIQDKHTIVYGAENLFVEEGAYVRAAIVNAEPGPVYLGKNSIVQEGAIIRGSFALCEGGHVNMGAKMRGDTTVGPFSKVGGEVSTSVIFGNSNKAHDGFMGCSVMGEWCNLGADTNTSNLKNNYDFVKVWSHNKNEFVNTGLQFCGLMMGDHSKCGINTMFNTGTTLDISANVFGEGFPPSYVPSFSWGGNNLTTYLLDKALTTASRVMARRNIPFDDMEKAILEKVYELTATNRIWGKITMKFSAIPGLDDVKKILVDAAKSSHIAHAQLFVGAEGALNLSLALAYATYLHCENKGDDSCGVCPACSRNSKFIHPDTHFVFPLSNVKGDKDEDRFKAEILKSWRAFLLEQPYGSLNDWTNYYGGEDKQALISREESREIIKKLSLKPFESPHKVMIIWQPELMHSSASNGILKILEEPPPHTYFILVTNAADRLLPTILSRTQIVTVPLLDDEEVETFLTEKTSTEKTKAHKVAQLSEGNLNLALKLLDNEEDNNASLFAEWMLACAGKSYLTLVGLSEQYHTLDKLSQKNVMTYGINMFRETLLHLSGAANIQRTQGEELQFVQRFSKVMDVYKLEKSFKLINDASYHLERNGSAKMIFLDLSLKLSQVIKP